VRSKEEGDEFFAMDAVIQGYVKSNPDLLTTSGGRSYWSPDEVRVKIRQELTSETKGGGQETEEEYPDEQIEKARAIAQNPSHPRNKDAIRFLKSIGQSY
jgi:hypothetical protein